MKSHEVTLVSVNKKKEKQMPSPAPGHSLFLFQQPHPILVHLLLPVPVLVIRINKGQSQGICKCCLVFVCLGCLFFFFKMEINLRKWIIPLCMPTASQHGNLGQRLRTEILKDMQRKTKAVDHSV